MFKSNHIKSNQTDLTTKLKSNQIKSIWFGLIWFEFWGVSTDLNSPNDTPEVKLRNDTKHDPPKYEKKMTRISELKALTRRNLNIKAKGLGLKFNGSKPELIEKIYEIETVYFFQCILDY